MKKSNLVLVVASLISVSAFAANRKPSAIPCGDKEGAITAAVTRAQSETKQTCKGDSKDTALEGPTQQFYQTWHVEVLCGSDKHYYDAETHLNGTPGNLHCAQTVEDSGQLQQR
jgi:hypothetical protein